MQRTRDTHYRDEHDDLTADHWNGWTLDTDHYALQAPGVHRYYFWRIDETLDSPKMLDSIMQMVGKNWVDDHILAGLVRAFDDILNPQHNLCSFGSNRKITKNRAIELVDAVERLER